MPLWRYTKIREQFIANEPFVPVGLHRQVLLSKIFNRKFIKDSFLPTEKKTKITPAKFYKKLAIFHCLYTFVKFNGIVPINEIIKNRPGKYNMLFFNEVRNKKLIGEELEYGPNLITYLKNVFNSDALCLKIDSTSITCTPNPDKELSDKEYKNLLLTIIMAEVSKNLNECLTPKEREEIRLRLSNHLIVKSSREINAVYNDPKHGIFFPFKQSNIINTNLELTWKFFHFATSESWKTLCMMDDSGKPIFNLHAHSTKKKCYLRNMSAKDQKVILLHTISNPIAVDRHAKTKELTEIFPIMEKEMGAHFERYLFDGEKTMHKMALFLDESGKPLYGIYFFKPVTKAQINPVYFDLSNQGNRLNLEYMLDLFLKALPSDNEFKKSFKGRKKE